MDPRPRRPGRTRPTLTFLLLAACLVGVARGAPPEADPLARVLDLLPPEITLLAFERITLDHPDPRVFQAFARIRDTAPRLLTDPELHARAKVGFLSTRKTYATLSRREIRAAQDALRARGHAHWLRDAPLRAAFLYLARNGEVTARLIRDTEELLAVETARMQIRLSQTCLTDLEELNQALARRHLNRIPLPEGQPADVLEVLHVEERGLGGVGGVCPRDGAAYRLEREVTPPRFVCRNHEPPRKRVPVAPPPDLRRLARTNAVAWARLEKTPPAPAAPVPRGP